MKEFFLKYKVAIIVTVLVILFLGLSLLMDSNEKTVGRYSESVSEWLEATKKDEPIVTVFAASWCHNCASHKPVMMALQEEYGFNLFWFEVDILQEEKPEEYEALMNAYEISDYTGAVPFTFAMKNGKYLGNVLGAQGRDAVANFLKNNNIIE